MGFIEASFCCLSFLRALIVPVFLFSFFPAFLSLLVHVFASSVSVMRCFWSCLLLSLFTFGSPSIHYLPAGS